MRRRVLPAPKRQKLIELNEFSHERIFCVFFVDAFHFQLVADFSIYNFDVNFFVFNATLHLFSWANSLDMEFRIYLSTRNIRDCCRVAIVGTSTTSSTISINRIIVNASSFQQWRRSRDTI